MGLTQFLCKPEYWIGMAGQQKLDQKDREIAGLLQQDAWMTNAQVGDRVNLSPSAVQRRIERLRAIGAIAGARALLDPALFGRKIRIYVMIELHDDSASSLDAIVRDLCGFPEVVEVNLLTGIFDLILIADFADMESYADFAMEKLNINRNIKHCHTLTRLKNLV